MSGSSPNDAGAPSPPSPAAVQQAIVKFLEQIDSDVTPGSAEDTALKILEALANNAFVFATVNGLITNLEKHLPGVL